jgi:glycosyltransferase involved in cell wall biosynthesis
VVFLNNIFSYLGRIEEARLPFVFELYPGGGFHLNDPASDARLRRVFDSPLFRKVIATQSITRDYLLQKKLCEEQKIEFIYGGVLSSDSLYDIPSQRALYGSGKETIDICFVADKYMPRGADKGYDRYIECAHILCRRYQQARFHVVGNFTQADVDVSALGDQITFYGFRFTPFFPPFYSRMDIILSPNVPFLLYPGKFDGFPTGGCIEAALCGTAIFATDELGMNEGRLKDREEIVLISREPDEIAETVGKYVADPSRLAALAQNGQRAVRQLFSLDAQMTPRLRVLSDLLSSASGGFGS